jgi:hypothetical protein
MTTRAKLLALAISGLAPTSGCSWYFVRPLPVESAGVGYRDCTTSRIPPVVDTLLALTYIAEAIYVGGSDQATHKEAGIAVGLALASVWALSATYGYWETSQCEEATAARRTAMPPLPLWGTSQPQLYPQPPPPPPSAGAPAAETATSAPAVVPATIAPSQVQQPDGGH